MTGRLVVVSGLPGVGKKSVTEIVVARTRSVYLSIDAVEESILASSAPCAAVDNVPPLELRSPRAPSAQAGRRGVRCHDERDPNNDVQIMPV